MFWLGLITSVAFVPGYIGATIPTNWVVLSMLLPLALWREVALTPLHWVLFAFLAYAFLSLLWTVHLLNSLWQLWLLSIFALAFYLGSSLGSLRSIYSGLAVGLSISSSIAIFQALGFNPVLSSTTGNPAGLLFNPVVLGISIALLAVALVTERMWLYLPALAPGLYLANSRGAYLVLFGGLIATKVRNPIYLATLAAGAFIYFTWSLSPSDTERMMIWRAAYTNLTPFGNGPGSFLSVWFQRGPGHFLHPEYVHNDFLQFVFEYGVGAILLLTVLAGCASRIAAPEWPVFAAFLLAACFFFPFVTPIPCFLGALCAGRLASTWRNPWPLSLRRGYHFLPWISPQGHEPNPPRRSPIPA